MTLIPLPDQIAAGSPDANAPALTPTPVTPSPVQADPNQAALLSSPDQAADAALQLRVNQPAPAGRSLFATKLASALDQNPIQLQPNGKPAPGSWSRSLVGAAQNALSNIGDIPDSKAPVGAGFISGLTKTISNRNQRVAAQQEQAHKQAHEDEQDRLEQQRADDEHKQSQIETTEANLRMLHQQALAHQVGIDSDIAEGNRTLKMLTDPASGHPTPVAASGITFDDIQRGVIDGKWNLHDFKPLATGKKVVGEDPDTKDPIYATTYDLVNSEGKVKPDAKEIEFLNANKAANGDQEIQPGQDFTFSKWALLHQRASDVATATAARNKTVMENDLANADELTKLEKVNFGPEWVNALGQAKGDPIKARNAMLANPKIAAKYPNLQRDVAEAYPGFDKLEAQHDEATEQIREKAAEKAADDAHEASGIPMTNDMASQINALPPDKKAVLLGAAKGDSVLQATLMSLAQNDGSLDLERVFPNRTYKGTTHMTLDQAAGVIKELNPDFNEQTYKALSKAYASLLPGTPTGHAIVQYNNVLRHAAKLQDVLTDLNTNANPKFVNTAVNKMKSEGVGVDPAKITAAMEPLKSEFELLNSGNYKPDEEMKKSYNTILDPNSTPNQISAAVKGIVSTGAIRLSDLDEDYFSLAGKHIPNLVTPAGLAAAEHVGINTPQGDPQTWSLLKSLAGNQNPQFRSGIPPEKTIIPPTVPKEATHIYKDAQGNIKGYALGGTYHPLGTVK